ncbi:hypothetical protein ACJX0J_023811 [Zea mays]
MATKTSQHKYDILHKYDRLHKWKPPFKLLEEMSNNMGVIDHSHTRKQHIFLHIPTSTLSRFFSTRLIILEDLPLPSLLYYLFGLYVKVVICFGLLFMLYLVRFLYISFLFTYFRLYSLEQIQRLNAVNSLTIWILRICNMKKGWTQRNGHMKEEFRATSLSFNINLNI